MNGKKPLMDYRRVQKLQTPLLLSGALLIGVGTSVSIPLVILGIAIMLFALPTAPTAARRSTRRWRSPCAA